MTNNTEIANQFKDIECSKKAHFLTDFYGLLNITKNKKDGSNRIKELILRKEQEALDKRCEKLGCINMSHAHNPKCPADESVYDY